MKLGSVMDLLKVSLSTAQHAWDLHLIQVPTKKTPCKEVVSNSFCNVIVCTNMRKMSKLTFVMVAPSLEIKTPIPTGTCQAKQHRKV